MHFTLPFQYIAKLSVENENLKLYSRIWELEIDDLNFRAERFSLQR